MLSKINYGFKKLCMKPGLIHFPDSTVGFDLHIIRSGQIKLKLQILSLSMILAINKFI